MKGMATGAIVAAVVLFGSVAPAGDGAEITSAVLRDRMVLVVYFGESGPPRMPMVDVNLRGKLPDGFDLAPTDAPASLIVTLNDVDIYGDESDPSDIRLSPTGKRGRWDLASEEGVLYARWLRARLDLRKGTFNFRTRYVDHAVMEGDPTAVPLVIRIGDREFTVMLDFQAPTPDLWFYRKMEPRLFPLDRR